MYVSRSVLLGQVHIFRLIPFVQIDIFNVPLCGVFFKSCLTPLNRNISGLKKMHAHACEQYIFLSCNKSDFNTVRFMKIRLHAYANVKKKKSLQDFNFCAFSCRFQLTS